MESRAQSHLSHLLENKQDPSVIFAFVFTSLIAHNVDLRIAIETVISQPASGQDTPKMSVLSDCYKNHFKQTNNIHIWFSFPPIPSRRAGHASTVFTGCLIFKIKYNFCWVWKALLLVQTWFAGAESFWHGEQIVQTLTVWTTAKAMQDCDFSSHWEILYFLSVPSKIKGLLRPCLWSKSQPQKVNILKCILYLLTFVQHQAQGSICSPFCLLCLAGAQRGTLPCTYTNLICKSTSCTHLWTPDLAELLLSVPQSEPFVAMQESGVWWAVTFCQTILQTWRMFSSVWDQTVFSHQHRLVAHVQFHNSACTSGSTESAALLSILCWLPALLFTPGTAHPAQRSSSSHTHGTLTGHPMNARTWTPECMNLIAGRESKQRRAPIFSRKLSLLHFHPSSLLNMQQQQQLTFIEVGREGRRVKVLNFHQIWTINHNL